jgi:hypothetical protein
MFFVVVKNTQIGFPFAMRLCAIDRDFESYLREISLSYATVPFLIIH